jgi:hypothetical protein
MGHDVRRERSVGMDQRKAGYQTRRELAFNSPTGTRFRPAMARSLHSAKFCMASQRKRPTKRQAIRINAKLSLHLESRSLRQSPSPETLNDFGTVRIMPPRKRYKAIADYW